MLPSIFGENMMDEFFDRDFFGERNPLFGKHARNLMKTDIHENDKEYELSVELPGFKKEDIKIDVEDDCLTISAERKVDEDKKDEKNNFVKRERYYGSYSRSFDVSGINIDGIEASYTDGVLTLTMPKKAAEVPASRRLEIK